MTEVKQQNTETTVGVVAYITLIGFIIALVLNNDKKGEDKAFGAFHLRQALGLMLTGIVVMVALMIVITIFMFISISFGGLFATILYPVLYLGMLALLIIGIINAANGQKKELPVIGPMISKIFGKAFE
ncbi:hypothetical protein CW751_09650 [Brumimicrobium salinarum]|uniref:DUF4870 domain-containing protein n=1 Tax=Brumimicrobium salinarum TaxID=2058658 RepID=A0A2I0R219_9FLAO|nr:DUF4870 domain-containing protein [Brumimicrobium salinarum]PKR80624.1 hypothetical protein CW751_09650 [Brumimicrobium salinarum]